MPRINHVVLLCVVALLLVPTPAAAQAKYTYNWSTGVVDDADTRLRAGQRIELVVNGLNPVCYSTNITATVTDVKEDFSKFIAGFGPPQPTQPTTPRDTAAEPVQPADPAPTIPDTVVVVPLSPMTELELELDLLESNLEGAHALLRQVERARTEAAPWAATLKRPPCDLGRGWDAPRFLAEANTRLPQLKAAMATANEAMPVIEQEMRRIDGKIDDLTRKFADPAERKKIETVKSKLDEAEALSKKRRAALDSTSADFDIAASRLPFLAAATSMTTSVRAGHDAESLRLIVRATPLPGLEPVAKADSVVITEPIRRRFRAFVSTGLFVSFLEGRDYERVNRARFVTPAAPTEPPAEGEPAPVNMDSAVTYSTFARVERDLLDVVSPTVQFNMSFAEHEWGGSWLASFGAALRTVNGSALPEPFAGISFSLNDRLVVSGGLHFGRTEELLITTDAITEDDIAARAIPVGITGSDAVGVSWKRGGFLSLSIKP